MLRKFLQDYFSYQLSHILGGRKYTDWAQETLTLQKNIPIKDKKLAKELEEACAKKGFLTYSEFLTIDQFGKYGYHSTHKEHGMTDVQYRWPKALAALCIKKNISHIVEFGPGNGTVGAKALLEGKKLGKNIRWSGVEINKSLQDQTKKLFTRHGLQKQLIQLVSSINDLQLTEKCLFVFSYSLDNLIPDVFINTGQKQSFPNAMVGVTIKNGLLSEVVLSSNDKNMQFLPSVHHSILKDTVGYSWNIHEWQLNYMQRLYVPLEAYQTLITATNMLPKGSQMLIIDEFREPTHSQPYHYGVPKDLETFSRDFTDLKKFYATAGSNLLYFLLFLDSLIDLLPQLEFSLEERMGEDKLAYILSDKTGPLPKYPLTFALLTSPKKIGTHKKQFTISCFFASAKQMK